MESAPETNQQQNPRSVCLTYGGRINQPAYTTENTCTLESDRTRVCAMFDSRQGVSSVVFGFLYVKWRLKNIVQASYKAKY